MIRKAWQYGTSLRFAPAFRALGVWVLLIKCGPKIARNSIAGTSEQQEATCHIAMPQCCYLAKGAKRPSHTIVLTSSNQVLYMLAVTALKASNLNSAVMNYM